MTRAATCVVTRAIKFTQYRAMRQLNSELPAHDFCHSLVADDEQPLRRGQGPSIEVPRVQQSTTDGHQRAFECKNGRFSLEKSIGADVTGGLPAFGWSSVCIMILFVIVAVYIIIVRETTSHHFSGHRLSQTRAHVERGINFGQTG